jgi:hypothetical protein
MSSSGPSKGCVYGHRCSPCCTSPEHALQPNPCDLRLWQAASGVTSSYDALLELFERLGYFLKRLEIYMTISLTTTMTDIIVKILVEVLSVLALATKEIKQGRFSKCAITYIAQGSMWRREVRQKVVGEERD